MFTGFKTIGGVFQHRFYHNKHMVTIDNPNTDADLLVDNISFNDVYGKRIWNRMSAQTIFKSEETKEYPVETFNKVVIQQKKEPPNKIDQFHENAFRADFLELNAENTKITKDLFDFDLVNTAPGSHYPDGKKSNDLSDPKLASLFENKMKISRTQEHELGPTHVPQFANKSLLLNHEQRPRLMETDGLSISSMPWEPRNPKIPPLLNNHESLLDFEVNNKTDKINLIEVANPLESIFEQYYEKSNKLELLGLKVEPKLDIFSTPQVTKSYSHPDDWLNVDMESHLKQEEKSAFEELFS